MTHLLKYILLIFPIFWLALIPVKLDFSWSTASTLEKLKLMQLAIDKFRTQYHRFPESSSEIRSYILAQGITFTPYDYFGMRVQYMSLSNDEYFVKSFGPDQIINHPGGEKDLTIVKMKAQKRIPASQESKTNHLMKLFPAPLLVGNRPRNKNYYARIITENINHSRRLIVRGLTDNNFIITSFHDGVEEFLWLGDGHTIVFSANGSPRYQDGIYLWDITNNSTVNILSKVVARGSFNIVPPLYCVTISN